MRVAIITFFPIIGSFNFFRIQGYPEIGLLLFVGFIFFIFFIQFFLKPILSTEGNIPIGMSRRMGPIESFHTKLMSLFVLIMIVGLFKTTIGGYREITTGIAEIITILTIFVFIYFVITDAIRCNYFDSLINLFGISLSLLLLMNIFGFILGINSATAENYNQDLTNPYPFIDYRILFPFTISGQVLSIQAGIVVIVGIFGILKDKKILSLPLSLLMIFSGLFILIGHGGRMAMIMLILTIIAGISFHLVKRLLPLVLLTFISFPLLVLIDLGSVVESFFNLLGLNFSRHEGDVASFSNRDVIFGLALLGFFLEGGISNILFGYGAYGQVVSGISESYAFIFQWSYANPYEAHVHNSALQILLDYGIVGLMLFIYLTISASLIVLKKSNKKLLETSTSSNRRLYFVLLIYLISTSMTESTISYLSFNVLTIFFILNLVLAFDSVNTKFNKEDIMKVN